MLPAAVWPQLFKTGEKPLIICGTTYFLHRILQNQIDFLIKTFMMF